MGRALLASAQHQFLPDIDWTTIPVIPVRGDAHIQKLMAPLAHSGQACRLALKLNQAAFLKPGLRTLVRVAKCLQGSQAARQALLPELATSILKVRRQVESRSSPS